jgi:prophage regulatory protein
MMNRKKPLTYMRLPEVLRRTGLKHTTINEMEARGKFPGRIKLSERAVGWVESEVEEWLEQRFEETRNQSAVA